MRCKKNLCLLLMLLVCQIAFWSLISLKFWFDRCPTSLFTALCCLTLAVSFFLVLVTLDQGFRSEADVKKRIIISLFQGKVFLAVVGCLAWSDICLVIIMLKKESHCAQESLVKKLAILFTLPSLVLFLLAFRILGYYFKYKPFSIRREFHVRRVFLMQQRGSRLFTQSNTSATRCSSTTRSTSSSWPKKTGPTLSSSTSTWKNDLPCWTYRKSSDTSSSLSSSSSRSRTAAGSSSNWRPSS
jgi:hypothetical protein